MYVVSTSNCGCYVASRCINSVVHEHNEAMHNIMFNIMHVYGEQKHHRFSFSDLK